jgi:hypothetical protein
MQACDHEPGKHIKWEVTPCSLPWFKAHIFTSGWCPKFLDSCCIAGPSSQLDLNIWKFLAIYISVLKWNSYLVGTVMFFFIWYVWLLNNELYNQQYGARTRSLLPSYYILWCVCSFLSLSRNWFWKWNCNFFKL